jgi:heptose-I-phosphate ethanolaminephosphotransferase
MVKVFSDRFIKKHKFLNIKSLCSVALFFLSVYLFFSLQKSCLQSDIYEYPNVNKITVKTLKNPDVEITFKFKQNGWHGEGDNIFQTSYVNDGIRLEMTPGGESHAPGWGLILSSKDKGIEAINLGELPIINEWNELFIKIDGLQKNLKVNLNSKTVFDAKLLQPKYLFNDILIGAGFSDDRKFNGEIIDFSIKYVKFPIILLIFKFLLLQTIFFIVMLYVCELKTKQIVTNTIITKLGWVVYFCINIYLAQTFNHFTNLTNALAKDIICWEILLFIPFFFYKIGSYFQIKNLQEIIICSAVIMCVVFHIIPMSSIESSTFLLMLVIIFIFVLYLLSRLNNNFRKILFLVSCVTLFSLFCVISCIALYFYRMQVNFFTVEEMSAFIQSNVMESFEFIVVFFKLQDKILILLSSILVVFIFAKFLYQNIRKIKIPFNKIAYLFVASVILNIAVFYHSSTVTLINISISNLKKCIMQFTKYKEVREKIVIPDNLVRKKEQKGECYIVVIGESSNRLHWSAYGYFRNTTPWALSQKNNLNSIIFDNVYTSFVHTVPALMKALTASNQYNKREDIFAESIIGVAQKAGFKVHWISNQNKISFVDNPLSALIEEADEVIFMHKNTTTFGTDTDELLLPVVDKVLKSMNNEDNNLIIVHLLGSHFDYKCRLPKNFKTDFVSSEDYLGNHASDKKFIKDILNPYDASILYTDTILEQLYNKFLSVPSQVKAFLYFSDHAEDVYGRKFHNSGLFVYEMARIPMFLLFSEAYKNRYPNVIKNLKESKEKVFTIDLFFNLGLSLMGIESSLNEKAYNLTDIKYSINKDNALTMYTDDSLDETLYAKTLALKISNDPIFIKQDNLKKLKLLYPNKIFGAIRMEVVGGAITAVQEGFDSIETNINAFDFKMGHAPDKLYDMTLDEYLSLIPLDKINNIWLDMKNLDEKDISRVIEKLNKLDEKYKLKNKMLIENVSVYPKMKEFTENGWRNCFYLFFRFNRQDVNKGFSYEMLQIILNMDNLSSEEDIKLRKFAYEIARYIQEQKSTDLSFHPKLYPFVKKYLEPLISPSIKYNTFSIENMPEIDSINFIDELTKRKIPILSDERVRIILIDSKNKFFIL